MLKSDVLGRNGQVSELAVNHDTTYLRSELHLAPRFSHPSQGENRTTALIKVPRSKSVRTKAKKKNLVHLLKKKKTALTANHRGDVLGHTSNSK